MDYRKWKVNQELQPLVGFFKRFIHGMSRNAGTKKGKVIMFWTSRMNPGKAGKKG